MYFFFTKNQLPDSRSLLWIKAPISCRPQQLAPDLVSREEDVELPGGDGLGIQCLITGIWKQNKLSYDDPDGLSKGAVPDLSMPWHLTL